MSRIAGQEAFLLYARSVPDQALLETTKPAFLFVRFSDLEILSGAIRAREVIRAQKYKTCTYYRKDYLKYPNSARLGHAIIFGQD